MTYVLEQQGGHAPLALGGTTLVFEGIPAEGADARTKATGFFQVSGPGTTQGQSAVDGVTLTYRYTDGVTKVSLGDYDFQVAEKGTKLVFGEQTFAVGAKTVHVAKDGQARSE